MIDDQYLAIKDRAADRFMRLPHVSAVGIGCREEGGEVTDELAIKVFVTKKKPVGIVARNERIPATFEGLRTDVVEVGRARRCASVPGVVSPAGHFPDLNEYTPLRGGVSFVAEGVDKEEGVSHLGTLGCFLRDKQDGSAIYALTNYHVVTGEDRKLSRSRSVAHPSVVFDLTKHKFEEANSKGIVSEGGLDALRDAAVVRLDHGVAWVPFIEEIGYLRGRRHITSADLSTKPEVRKRGAKTRLSGGVIDSIGDVEVEGIRHKNCLLIRPNRPRRSNPPDPSDPDPNEKTVFGYLGDSGSVVVDEQNRVVGLYFATNDRSNEPTSGFGYAFRIQDVLELFRKHDGLDLEVAIAKHATADDTNPDDPNELQEVPHPAGVPEMAQDDQVRASDHAYYRPLIGGSQIQAEDIGEPNATTLGCVVTDDPDSGVAYIVTSYAGISLNGSLPPSSSTDVSQPVYKEGFSPCCNNGVGAFRIAGPLAAAPTVALIQLEEDHKWVPQIMRVGLLKGHRTIEPGDLTSFGPITVRKCGPSSALTSGVVVRVPGSPVLAGVPADAMLIKPHDNPSSPTAPVAFSRFLDRGAVLVDGGNRVVGVLHGQIDIFEGSRRITHGLATPIQTLLNALATSGVNVAVPDETDIRKVRTSSARVALPEDEARVAAVPLVQPVSAGREAPPVPLAGDVWTSPGGLTVVAAWQRHQQELRDLISRNRRVAAIWHRSGGPALVQAFVRATRVPAARIPGSVNGLPVLVCLDRLTAAFCRYGSAALQADILRVRSQSPSIAGLTLAEILDAASLGALAADLP